MVRARSGYIYNDINITLQGSSGIGESMQRKGIFPGKLRTGFLCLLSAVASNVERAMLYSQTKIVAGKNFPNFQL